MAVDHPKKYWRVPAAAEQYESLRFDGWRGRLYRSLEERAVCKALQAVTPGSRVLDAPCGTGRITSYLLRGEFAAVGYDISMPMICVARRQIAPWSDQVMFFQGDVASLPYRNASFDAVTCIGLLMHLDADARVRVLQELARVSRHLLIVQYGCMGKFLCFKTWVTGRKPGDVLYPVVEAEMRGDFKRSGVRELTRFWVLRPFSSSVVLLLSK